MMTMLAFIGSAVVLTYEGKSLLALFARGSLTRREVWMLGFPVGALVNALLFFVCTIVGWSLSLSVIYSLHAVVIIFLALLLHLLPDVPFQTEKDGNDRSMHGKITKVLMILLVLSIAIKLFYALSHALLPTLYYDSLSQWTMRSQVSFIDLSIAFDTDELRGVSKSQYPILFHSLQIFFHLPLRAWSDLIANVSTLLLTFFSFLSFYLLLARCRGRAMGLLTLGLILMIPLVSLHLSQGYADIHLIAYILLSALCLYFFLEKRGESFLIFSALFIAAAAWVKPDGLFFGIFPWLLLTGAYGFYKKEKKIFTKGWLPALLLGSPWYLMLLFRGMPITPHRGGLGFEWHAEAGQKALSTLFAAGSFGIFWYVLLAILIFLFLKVRKDWRNCVPEFLLLSWGMFTLFEALYVFLFTPNVTFLLNAQTFSRTMLIPLCLLILGCVLLIQHVILPSALRLRLEERSTERVARCVSKDSADLVR